jgi:hypothetical protein
VKHLRMVGLALVAVFAMAALAATSASALPEWGQCYVQAKHEGKYTDKNCTVKAKKVSEKFTGAFEWRKSVEVVNKHFAGAGGAGVLTAEPKICLPGEERRPKCAEGEKEEASFGAVKVECESEVNHGEATGSKEVKNVSVSFRGCKIFGTSPCSNSNVEGEIKTNTLKGTLGYIKKLTTPKQVGVLLEPTVKKGEFAKFVCITGQLGTVVGVGNEKEGCAYPLPACGGDGIISPITPVNEMTKELTQVYTINEALENIPNKFEGKPLKVLEMYLFNTEKPSKSSKWSRSGETITNVNTQESEEEIEIKA